MVTVSYFLVFWFLFFLFDVALFCFALLWGGGFGGFTCLVFSYTCCLHAFGFHTHFALNNAYCFVLFNLVIPLVSYLLNKHVAFTTCTEQFFAQCLA